MCSENNQNAWAGSLLSPTKSTNITPIPSNIIRSLSQTTRSRKNDSQLAFSVSKAARSNWHLYLEENPNGIALSLRPHNFFQDFLQYSICTDKNLWSERKIVFWLNSESLTPRWFLSQLLFYISHLILVFTIGLWKSNFRLLQSPVFHLRRNSLAVLIAHMY